MLGLVVASLGSCILVGARVAAATLPPLPAVDLRAEHARLPATGLQARHPRFSWSLRQPDSVRGTVQSAYQIKVSLAANTSNSTTAATIGGAAWDSGLMRSNDTTGVTCGAALASDTAYTLSVQWWDQAGVPAPVAVGGVHDCLTRPRRLGGIPVAHPAGERRPIP